MGSRCDGEGLGQGQVQGGALPCNGVPWGCVAPHTPAGWTPPEAVYSHGCCPRSAGETLGSGGGCFSTVSPDSGTVPHGQLTIHSWVSVLFGREVTVLPPFNKHLQRWLCQGSFAWYIASREWGFAVGAEGPQGADPVQQGQPSTAKAYLTLDKLVSRTRHARLLGCHLSCSFPDMGD